MSKALENLRAIKTIRKRLKGGEITRDQAEIEAKPVIESIHKNAADIAARRGIEHNPVTFAELMA